MRFVQTLSRELSRRREVNREHIIRKIYLGEDRIVGSCEQGENPTMKIFDQRRLATGERLTDTKPHLG